MVKSFEKKTMLIISVFPMLIFPLVLADRIFPDIDLDADDWWLHVTRERFPLQPTEPACLLRAQSIVTRDDYTYTPGIGGYKVHTNAVTWPKARRICEDEGGHLAIMNSVAESKVVTDLWNKTRVVSGGTGNGELAYIGFHDLFQEGEHVTIYGQSLAKAGFDQWSSPGQPDNDGGAENCGTLYKKGGLNDEKCDVKHAFICELPVY